MNDKSLTPWKAAIADAQNRFVALADEQTWARESLFAMQLIMKNDYLLSIANSNPASLRNAVTNVAAIGITLNPAEALAYLVPRDGAACLDISYRGLLKLATDSGAIKWGKAENVYSNDNFVFNGPAIAPEHRYDPFTSDRGDYQGSYCIARTADGDTLVEAMSASEIYEIRDKSELYKRKKMGPWKDFFGEMAKKTVIKRASKTWPKSTGGRLEKAIEYLNNSGEGIQFAKETTPVKDVYTIEQQEQFHKFLEASDSLAMHLLEKTIPQSAWIDLYNSGEKNRKGVLKQKVDHLIAQGREIVDAIIACIDSSDEPGLLELVEDSDGDMLEHLPALLGMEYGSAYMEMMQNIKAA